MSELPLPFIELTVDGKPIAFHTRHIETVAPAGTGAAIGFVGSSENWLVEESYHVVMRRLLIGHLEDEQPMWLKP